MTGRRRAIAIALTTTLLCAIAPIAPTTALAQPNAPSEDDRKEARERFDRGLALFNDGDNPAALAEFKRAFELIPNPIVLYNVGLVYAAMGRPVEAVEALDRVLASPGALSGERLTRATQTRAEQAGRIATLSVVTNVPATIQVDNIDVARTPLPAPIQVAGGVHVVGAMAHRFAPTRKEVTVAGGATAEVKLDLVEMNGLEAHLTIKTHLPGADVVIDDQVIGKTPPPQSFTVAPGSHIIELRRAGYTTARQTIFLGDGASGEVTLEPEGDPAALGALAGTLAIRASETDVVATVDGKARGLATIDGLRLVQGVHHLLLERAGFRPVERDIIVDAGRTTTINVTFDPTPETRAAYASRTSAQRTWGIVSAAAGVALAGGSVAFLVWNGRQRTMADGDLASAEFNIANKYPKGSICDAASLSFNKAACNQVALDAQSSINDANTRDVFGWVGVGVGAAAAVLGAVLLTTNGNTHRYDHASRGFLWPVAWGDARSGGMGIVGSF